MSEARLQPSGSFEEVSLAGFEFARESFNLDVHVERAMRLTGELIKHRSFSGVEMEAAEFLAVQMSERFDAEVRLLPLRDGSFNVMVFWGVPSILFTSHIDVVAAPDHLFEPVYTDTGVRERGACDAKGCIAAMMETAAILRARGENNFGLLFVVGEGRCQACRCRFAAIGA